MRELSMTLVIPTWRPGPSFRKLMERIARQTKKPDRVIIVNTEESYFPPEFYDLWPGAAVIHIRREDFDHGGTRNMAARMCDTDLVVFMTMDALPADSRLLERLARPFADPLVGAAYARQLPAKDAGPIERFTRQFNYGGVSEVRSREDIPRLGVKAFFCSDVCAAYRLSLWRERGGFVSPAIFNEDMIYAGGVILAGGKVAYCADAKVCHSHNYSGLMQLHRNFDLGVSQAQHPEIFGQAGASEGAGIRLVKETAAHLAKSGNARFLPRLVWTSGCKYLGYRLGKGYKRLPMSLIRRLTDNAPYWARMQ